jgi:hypothetical protein
VNRDRLLHFRVLQTLLVAELVEVQLRRLVVFTQPGHQGGDDELRSFD